MGSQREPTRRKVLPRWLATNPGKRWTELYFLGFAVVWISSVAAIVATGAYEWFTAKHYMAVGLYCALPCFFGPLLFSGQGEKHTPLLQRFWMKANLWQFILSFIGNYLWTHYFYTLLGAKYTFDAWRLNDVPFALFLVTQAYFTFYHSLITIVLRRFWTSTFYSTLDSSTAKSAVSCGFVLVLAYVTAFMETWTIAAFPYYTFIDRQYMYTVGSACYGLYFIVTFPMYYRLDEGSERWSLGRTAVDALGACMLVTMLLDAWRLTVGGITDYHGVPWLKP